MYYIISPHFQYGTGYAFNFQNRSYANISSKNELDSLSTYLMPYDIVKQLTLIKQDYPINHSASINSLSSKKMAYFSYLISIVQPSNNTNHLILNQAYHEGWSAYAVTNDSLLTTSFPFLFGKKLQDHVLVNNWANGWKLNSNDFQIVIFFWPQYLEFAGFGLLILLSGWIIFSQRK